jgi:pre-mRNA-splicing factor RBM22/SLT11
MDLEPPEDQSVVTLWLGNIDPEITEEDIRGAIYAYGHIVSVTLIRSGKCAFVEYADRQTAEYAASQMYNALMVNGYALSVRFSY